jgi:NADPH:quinone reductase-like Zn-dependent oxidoreductase
MKKAQYSQRGPIPQDVIEAVEFESPLAGTGEVLIEVLAAPINPSDILTLTGEYGMLPPLPAVGGMEGVGKVAELGEGVDHLAVGQRVLLSAIGGTWTTHLLAPAKSLMPLPDGVDVQQQAMMTVNPPTAHLLLSEFVDFERGDWVIQNAANSAVGGYLIQIARQKGIKTINVVRRESAVQALVDAGGDVVLVDGNDLHKRVAEAVGDGVVRLAIDAVGGEATERLARAVMNSGVVVNYGLLSGEPCQLSGASLVFRDLTLKGFWLAKWFNDASAEQRGAVFAELGQMLAKGSLSARIQATYSIDEIKTAVAAAAAGGRDGKIMLLPNG